jgi:tRNA dimethylallyltransferase
MLFKYQMNQELIILTAPTASGKTGLLIELAKEFPIEVISADSRQVFKYMNIGTAKLSVEENKVVKHHLIDIINPDELYSAGKFEKDSIEIINDIKKRNKIPIVAGGTGFYIRALVDGMEEDNILDYQKKEVRDKINKWRFDFGDDFLVGELKKLDNLAFNLYQGQNIRRISRALEYFLITGKSITTLEHFNNYNYIPKYFIINTERDVLYEQINNRTIEMWENGFENEVVNLLKMGYSIGDYALNSVGYRECIAYLEGKTSKSFAITEMQKFTRHFAKRQMTWFNNQIDDNFSKIGNRKEILKNLITECEKYSKNFLIS